MLLLRGWSCCLMEKARRLRLFLLPAVASGGARDGQVSAGGALLPRARVEPEPAQKTARGRASGSFAT